MRPSDRPAAARVLRTALVAALTAGCGDERAIVGGLDATVEHDVADAADAPARDDATDATDAPPDNGVVSDCDSDLPTSLACTGLYTDLVAKTLAPSARAFAPAFPLWSDGAGKSRWIALSPGATIDRTHATDWVFPPGTRFWKEFSRNGHRVETRFFHKRADGRWVWVSYIWNPSETAALAAPDGDDVMLAEGGLYHVPSQRQCNQCHEGRGDRVMGFEEVSLGLPGATGLTLAQLATEHLLSPAPTSTGLSLGDDGTGDAARALGWLHINCGVSCHNSTLSAFANRSGLRFRLDPALLDGRATTGFDTYTDTVGVAASTGFWGNEDRIHPGDPDHSLLVYLVSNRATGIQMPPLATVVPDADNVALLREWITRLGATGDAGVHD